jgi:hypothetical protein
VGGKWVPEQHWPSVKYPDRSKEKRPGPLPYRDSGSDAVIA